MKKAVSITTTSFAELDKTPLDLLAKVGLDAILNPFGRSLSQQETLDLCVNSQGIIAGTEHYGRDLLQMLKNTRAISRCGAGLDSIDLEAARELGIKVLSTPDVPTLPVAELTIGLMITLLRHVGSADKNLRAGTWKKQLGNLLSGKCVGIVGFGRIGRKVAHLLKPFGCSVFYTDPALSDGIDDLPNIPLNDLLCQADIVTLHLSSRSPVLGEKEFALMKQPSWLINTSRGSVIDEDVLYDALCSGRLTGAALDVFGREPYQGRLCELSNVLLTPHIGSYAAESRVAMEMQACRNLLEALEAS